MNVEAIKPFLEDFERAGGTLPWLAPQRAAAVETLRRIGLPDLRDEDWKYTDLRPITRRRFRTVEGLRSDISAKKVQSARIEGLECHEMVFLNGNWSADLSGGKPVPGTMRLESLARAAQQDPALLEQHVNAVAPVKDSSFTALNTAFMGDGAVVFIPEDVTVAYPVHLLYLCGPRKEPFACHNRNIIVLGRNARLTLIENYIGLDDAEYLNNPVTEIVLEAGAQLEYYRLQQESRRGFHVGNTIARQDRDSRFTSHTVTLGGSLVRNDLHAQLGAEGAEAILNGLYLTGGRQHVDNHTRIDHLKPHTRSEEIYRGVLGGKSRAVFNGKVVVHKDAQKTDAQQSNANLLLSDDAEVDTKPELEIYADDVKCSHGATVGQMDPDVLFYLRSRAIPEPTARSLLTFAFADEVIRRMTLAPIRTRLEQIIADWMPNAERIREFVQ